MDSQHDTSSIFLLRGNVNEEPADGIVWALWKIVSGDTVVVKKAGEYSDNTNRPLKNVNDDIVICGVCSLTYAPFPI